MASRLIIMLFIITGISFYCALSISRRLLEIQVHPQLFLILFFIGFALLACGPIFDWVLPRSYPDIIIPKTLNSVLIEMGWLFFGFYSCLAVLVIGADIIELITRLLSSFSFYPHFKLIYHYFSLSAIALISISVLIIGRYNAKSPIIYPIEIVINNLPPAFDGYKIIQISDLHVSPIVRKKLVNDIVQLANNQHPDMIALTGDLVDGSVAKLAEDIMPLSKLSAPDGVFLVTGNHEYYSGVSPWLAFFPTLGITILNNQHILIHRPMHPIDKLTDKSMPQPNATLIVAGVPDYGTMRHHNPLVAISEVPTIDFAKTFLGAPENVPRILLAHTPDTYKLATHAKIDLQLSGHTHGGQYFPFTYFIRFFQTYYQGLYHIQINDPDSPKPWQSQLYVNKGTAFWGPPLRTWSKPEITLITLRSAKNKL